jgi:hypothetical protein
MYSGLMLSLPTWFAIRNTHGRVSFWLVGFIVLLLVIQGFSHDRFVELFGDHPQHAANDARHFSVFSSFSASSPLAGGKLFPHTGLIALPPTVALSLPVRSSTWDRESIAWLLEAAVPSRAPPSLKP